MRTHTHTRRSHWGGACDRRQSYLWPPAHGPHTLRCVQSLAAPHQLLSPPPPPHTFRLPVLTEADHWTVVTPSDGPRRTVPLAPLPTGGGLGTSKCRQKQCPAPSSASGPRVDGDQSSAPSTLRPGVPQKAGWLLCALCCVRRACWSRSLVGGGGELRGGWRDARVDCCLKLTGPTGPSPLPLVLSWNPFPP